MSGEETRRVRIPQDDQLAKVAEMAAEKAALIVGKSVVAELRRIRETLESIETEIRELKQMLAERGREERAGGGARRRAGAGLLSSRRFILASEAARQFKMSVDEILRIASEEGYRVLSVGSDIAVMSGDSYREFRELLDSVKSSDPAEAASLLGEYGRLFELLRRAGLVYYDYKSGKWALIES